MKEVLLPKTAGTLVHRKAVSPVAAVAAVYLNQYTNKWYSMVSVQRGAYHGEEH
jgi:hypothetical protein